MSSPHPTLHAQVKKVLIERKRLLAVDKRMIVVLVVSVFLVAATLHNYWVLLAALPGYGGMWLAGRRDPDLLDIYLKYRHQAGHYEPRQQLRQTRHQRPLGFARKHLC
ncbi:VirB3 family type IV secretion system protein [Mycoavidus sp. SF9855]|uniref:VirB3 family type IV secretion system protein n=1 Tax=Mycoavidus sp. SF9855 TaxID=2968475 RepID=UPI00211BDCEA|nr:VirB3 family type IV secretion system protein [Mycoavidus sp. SF9855]UUM22144.1 VirB3 family type IV secretion system protein [Mycoavidus sp. SF9855]